MPSSWLQGGICSEFIMSTGGRKQKDHINNIIASLYLCRPIPSKTHFRHFEGWSSNLALPQNGALRKAPGFGVPRQHTHTHIRTPARTHARTHAHIYTCWIIILHNARLLLKGRVIFYILYILYSFFSHYTVFFQVSFGLPLTRFPYGFHLRAVRTIAVCGIPLPSASFYL